MIALTHNHTEAFKTSKSGNHRGNEDVVHTSYRLLNQNEQSRKGTETSLTTKTDSRKSVDNGPSQASRRSTYMKDEQGYEKPFSPQHHNARKSPESAIVSYSKCTDRISVITYDSNNTSFDENQPGRRQEVEHFERAISIKADGSDATGLPRYEELESTVVEKQQEGIGKEESDHSANWNYVKFNKYVVAIVVLVSCISCIMCLIVIRGSYQQSFPDSEIMVQLPCENLTQVYHVAQLYKYTDDITNERFKAERIRRVKGTVNGVTYCEVPFEQTLGRLTRKEYDAVFGEVQMKAVTQGPTLSYSHGNLSVMTTNLGPHISHDASGLVIQLPGDYFVYFRMQLVYGHRTRCRDLPYKTSINHVLMGEHDTHRIRVLMGSEHTCCLSCEEETSTVFTGGLFRLGKKDKLFIQVSSPQIIGNSGETVLGLIRMTTPDESNELIEPG